ncbi:hypothetical protein E1B00_00630 [Arenimonas terrae]|uniref:Uncharacterized protein n=1 Tax=Arenimonas terrae TaxID=2546226 RepID=A0A5C4RSM1_9GAMM|nr:hypothetical protein E1B00_00630 [Arenimonas terrae]
MGHILPAPTGCDAPSTQRSKTMSLLGIFLVIVGLVLAIKITGFVLRLVFVGLIVLGLYLLVGPMLGAG